MDSTRDVRMTLRLKRQSVKDLKMLSALTNRNPTRLINGVLHSLRVEVEVMQGAVALFMDRKADNPDASLPKIDLIIARLLTRVLETRNFLPRDSLLRLDL